MSHTVTKRNEPTYAGKRSGFRHFSLALFASLFAIAGSGALQSAKADEFTVGRSGADLAFSQYNLTGTSVGVAVLDSGIRADRMDFGGRVTAEVNFVTTEGVRDICGHGSHIAGIIGGNGASSTGTKFTHTYYGVARNVNLLNVKVMDQNGKGTVSQVIAGIQWCMTNKAKYNIRVINLSLGHAVGESSATDPLCQAVEQAWKAGIFVVCAAGNSGRLNTTQTSGAANEGWGASYGSIQSPGNDPYAVTVGAMKDFDGKRTDDKLATYSSRGPSRLDLVMKPDLVAPGNKVISAAFEAGNLYSQYTANQLPISTYTKSGTTTVSGHYFVLSGTSMATPVVAGAAALLIQKDPTLKPDTIKARLMLTADKLSDITGATDPCAYGAGYLNIPSAIVSTAVPTRAVISPSLTQDANGNVFVDPNHAIWGTGVSGDHAIWGVSGVYDLRSLFGTHAIWGTSENLLDSSHAIWGTTVWNDHAIWGVSTGAIDISSVVIKGD